MKLVYIYSNGCSSNLLDGERMCNYFESNGYALTPDPESADIIVVNTCAFEATSEKDSLEMISRFQTIKKARMIVGGCLPAISKQKLREIYSGETFSPRSCETWSKLDDFIGAGIPISNIKEPSVLLHRWKDWKLIGAYKAFKENTECKQITGYDEDVYHLRISYGCTGQCTYCAIRFARGYIKSRPVEEIVDDFRAGLERGYRAFKIWGEDVGDYGVDRNTNLALLLGELLKSLEDFELEILAINPKRFIELYGELAPHLVDKRIKWLNLSIQSGSEKILRLMKREICLQDLTGIIRDLKQKAPHLIIRSHFIVGFPQEGWREYFLTVLYIFKIRTFKFLVWKYDPKPHTAASKMKGQVSCLRKNIYYSLLIFWGKLWALIYENGETY